MGIKDLHNARLVKMNSYNQIYLQKKLGYEPNEQLYVKKSKDKKTIILMSEEQFKHQEKVYLYNLKLKLDNGIIDPPEYRRRRRNFYSKIYIDIVTINNKNSVRLQNKDVKKVERVFVKNKYDKKKEQRRAYVKKHIPKHH